MPVEVLFRKVREGVERDTKRLQTPWELSSIKGDFVFNATGRQAAAGTGQAGAGPSADMAAQLELPVLEKRAGLQRRRRHPGLPRQVSQRRLRDAGAQPRRFDAGARTRRPPRRRLPRRPPCGRPAATTATAPGIAAGRPAANGRNRRPLVAARQEADEPAPRRHRRRPCRRAAPPSAAPPAAAAAGGPAVAAEAQGRPARPRDRAGDTRSDVRRRFRLRGRDARHPAARQGAVHLQGLQVPGRVQGRPQARHGQVRVGERRSLRRRVRRRPPERQAASTSSPTATPTKAR